MSYQKQIERLEELIQKAEERIEKDREKIKTYQEKIVELETFEIKTVLKEADLSVGDIRSIIDEMKLNKKTKEADLKEEENIENNSSF